jgi:hypothetical protein
LAEAGFWYNDHSLTEPDNVDAMRRLRGDQRGIPLILLQGETLAGFSRQRLSALLGLY